METVPLYLVPFIIITTLAALILLQLGIIGLFNYFSSTGESK